MLLNWKKYVNINMNIYVKYVKICEILNVEKLC